MCKVEKGSMGAGIKCEEKCNILQKETNTHIYICMCVCELMNFVIIEGSFQVA